MVSSFRQARTFDNCPEALTVVELASADLNVIHVFHAATVDVPALNGAVTRSRSLRVNYAGPIWGAPCFR
jgi:hypothetical protein